MLMMEIRIFFQMLYYTAPDAARVRLQLGWITGIGLLIGGAIVETVRTMDKVASSVASAVEQQGPATRECATTIQSAVQGTRGMASAVGSVILATRDTGSLSGELKQALGDLSGRFTRLESEAQGFMQRVQA